MKDHRQSVVLTTKYSLANPGTDPNAAGNQRKNMMQAVEASLKRLQTASADIRSIRRQISGQCFGGWSNARI
jgi:aryl-alcohol dehydrogenase-like predicted oxidoreductase